MKLLITDTQSAGSRYLIAFMLNNEEVIAMRADGSWYQNPKYTREQALAVISKCLFGTEPATDKTNPA